MLQFNHGSTRMDTEPKKKSNHWGLAQPVPAAEFDFIRVDRCPSVVA